MNFPADIQTGGIQAKGCLISEQRFHLNMNQKANMTRETKIKAPLDENGGQTRRHYGSVKKNVTYFSFYSLGTKIGR